MAIKNHKSLIQESPLPGLTKKALGILEEAYRAGDPRRAVASYKFPPLGGFESIYVLGFGKAAPAMAEALEKRLGNKITAGIVIGLRRAKTKRIISFVGTHPLPSKKNLEASEKILALAEKAGKKDLVIFLVSGGGSALLSLPKEGTSLSYLKRANNFLIKSGAPIQKINSVRKGMSRVKGGKLAQAAYPAKAVSLIVSDVVGDSPSVIASGPTFPPGSHPSSQTTKNEVILKNDDALEAMKRAAKKKGFKTIVLRKKIDGEARLAPKRIFAHAKKGAGPLAVIAGGETTVKVKGRGKGGRNQEICLAALPRMERLGDALLLSAASDGIDGNSGAAGVIAYPQSLENSKARGLDWRKSLKLNDSDSFFRKVGGRIATGKTDSNIMDFHLLLFG